MKQEISKPLMFGVIGALVLIIGIGGYFMMNRSSGGSSQEGQARRQQSGDPTSGYGGNRNSQGQQSGGAMSGYGGNRPR
jgi:hypothetical protein